MSRPLGAYAPKSPSSRSPKRRPPCRETRRPSW